MSTFVNRLLAEMPYSSGFDPLRDAFYPPEVSLHIEVPVQYSTESVDILSLLTHARISDDKGSSSASEDFIDLDAPPSHVLHEVGEGTKESEIGDSHDTVPMTRPKTNVELDSDEAEDVIHSGSGDDLEPGINNENKNDKHNISGDSMKNNETSTTSTVAYPSSTQANYNPSTSTTSTQITYTSTPPVTLRPISRAPPVLRAVNDTTKPATHTPTMKTLESSVDDNGVKAKPESSKKNCNEHESSAKWGPWSPWIQSGDKDFRFRSCNVTVATGKNATNITCAGERIQFSNCPVTEKKICHSANGEEKTSFVYECNGHDPMDIDIKYECLYSLYQVDSGEYKFVDWTYEKLQNEGKLHQWCTGPLKTGDDYRLKQYKRRDNNTVAVFTPLHSCKQKLEKFCRDSMPPCKYVARDAKGITNDKLHVECLKEFTLGGSIPSGIRNQNGGLTFLCQKFSSNTLFGDLFKRKTAHFASLYDSFRRVPTFSMSKLTAIDNKGWPRTPYLIERALIDKQARASWFYIVQYRKKGLAALSELEDEIQNDQCAVGKYQPQPSDYDFTTTYRIGHLLPPQLAGHQIDTKIAAFALTNTVPMHMDFYKEWKKAAKMIIKYAVDVCGVPQIDAEKTVTESTEPTQSSTTPFTTIATPMATKSTNSANTKNVGTSGSLPSMMADSSATEEKAQKPQLYLVAGAVPSVDPEVTIGNGVNVPDLIWLGGCCVRGNETKGFAVYGQNAAGRLVGATSLPQLEILLSQEYTKHTSRAHAFKIKIFPAYQGQCSKAPNDDSLKIAL
ncbi:probable serine serine/threonine-protein kinase DDB_G0277071 [Octopus vulgaris]|uniref:Probable serine serine/threonine-protein kinase DDB_G0277071 n=1 Tax=Octopus vulgaris TaxID=6645 RepID=A0AA36AXL5_OCTVU|nr:probable serine serine/threonine-protein kinase DDB_G0277071 [Octopus vulgaris]